MQRSKIIKVYLKAENDNFEEFDCVQLNDIASC